MTERQGQICPEQEDNDMLGQLEAVMARLGEINATTEADQARLDRIRTSLQEAAELLSAIMAAPDASGERLAAPAPTEEPAKERCDTSGQVQPMRQFVARMTPRITSALQKRYALESSDKYLATGMLLSPENDSFTDLQEEIIGDILREIGLSADYVEAPLDERRQIMLDILAQLHAFGMRDEHIKYFGAFVGLKVVAKREGLGIAGVTEPRTIGQMSSTVRDQGDIGLLTIQTKITQALILFLNATKAPQ